MEVAQSVGGIPALTAAVVVCTGIFGGMAGFKMWLRDSERRINWCIQPVTAMMMNVLIIVAPTIGIHWSRMIPKQRITPTPAGTKKNPRFLTKKSATLSTDSSRTHPAFSEAVFNFVSLPPIFFSNDKSWYFNAQSFSRFSRWWMSKLSENIYLERIPWWRPWEWLRDSERRINWCIQPVTAINIF